MIPLCTRHVDSGSLRSMGTPVNQHVIIVDCGVDVVACTSRRAHALLRKYFTVAAAENDSVPSALRAWLHAQRDGESDNTAQCLCVRKGASTLVVRLTHSTRYVAVIIFEELNAEATGPVRVVGEFTQREKEVMKWVCEGKRDREIGTILGLSTRTVGKHLEHVFQKLGVETRTAAARVAVERGINDRAPGDVATQQVSAA